MDIKSNWEITDLNRNRRKYIGGPDAAAIMGCGIGGRTNVDVYKSKINNEINQIPINVDMQMGLKLEDPILNIIDAMEKCTMLDQQYLVHNPDKDYIAGTPDRICENEEGLGIIEVKTCWHHMSARNYNMNDATMPKSTFWQILHYFLCDPDFNYVILAVGKACDMCRISIEWTTIHRTSVQSQIDELQRAEIRFWEEFVMRGNQPNYKLPDLKI